MTNTKENKVGKEKLFNKDFFLLWNGQTVSRIGSQIYYMAMLLWITDVTDSASLLGIMGMISSIPSILLSTIGGTFADRHSRKAIIIFSDVINAIIIFILAFIFYEKGDNISLIVSVLLGIAFINGLIRSFFTPAISAAIPDLVPKTKLTTANSFLQSAAQVSTIIAWAASGVLYVALGMPMLILINGITFVFGAITKSLITIPQKKLEVNPDGSAKNKFTRDLKEGMKFIWRNTGLKKLVMTTLVLNFFTIPVVLLLPFYVKDILMLDKVWISYFIITSAVGSVLGFLVAGFVRFRPVTRSKVIVIMMIFNAFLTILLGLNIYLWGAIAILIVGGLLNGFIQVHIQTILQLSTDTKIRGRVYGAISTLTGSLTPIGMAVFGIIGDLTGKNIPLIYELSGVILLLLTVYVASSSDIRKFLAYKPELIPETTTVEYK